MYAHSRLECNKLSLRRHHLFDHSNTTLLSSMHRLGCAPKSLLGWALIMLTMQLLLCAITYLDVCIEKDE